MKHDNAGVQEHACRALRNLAANDQNKIKIAKEGGIEAILNAMKHDHAGVQENACGALLNVCWNTESHWKIAIKHNAKELLIKAKENGKEALEKLKKFIDAVDNTKTIAVDELIEKYKKEFPEGDPVIVACEKGRLNDVKTFIQSGTVKDVHTYKGKNSCGHTRTLLGTASAYDQYEIVQYLLSLPGMDVSVADSDGVTAIMWAAYRNKKNLDLMKSILNHKTCSIDAVNKKDKYGSTALDCAKPNNGPLKNDIIQLLKSKGATE